jgi:hypothetical protein
LLPNVQLETGVRQWLKENGEEVSEPRMAALKVPCDFLCPITQEVMKHPVMNKHGINCEQQAILEWLNKGNNACPMTRNPLRPSTLLPSVQLETDVRDWLKENGEEVSEPQRGANNLDFMGVVCAWRCFFMWWSAFMLFLEREKETGCSGILATSAHQSACVVLHPEALKSAAS